MDHARKLYCELAKLYHPDKFRGPAEKFISEQLMAAINDAGSRGDLSMLQQIKLLGPAYLAVRAHKEFDFIGVPVSSPPAAEASPAGGGWQDAVEFLFVNCQPYALYKILADWDCIGRTRKVFGLSGSLAWNFCFYKLWLLLDAASVYLRHAGYAHESGVGLCVVILRGLIILVGVPCFLPLAFVVVFAAFLCVVFCLANFIATGILGYFHPYLAHLPPLVLAPLAVVTIWRILGNPSHNTV